jgi:LPXTG-site transpeptidase (sortase) family protein
VDLSVTKTDGVDVYIPTGILTYTIVVSNGGPNDATDATFTDSRPANISSWSWSCVATGTASCGATTTGTGDISVSDIDLPSGAGNFLTYTINATVSGSATGDLTNTAIVTAPAGTNDTDTGNNSASDTDAEGALFDPPSGSKIVTELGLQLLQWTMVWINDSNITALDVAVSDPIPPGATYDPTGASSGYPVPGGAPPGSVNTGITCTDTSAMTITTECYFEGPTGPYPRGRVVWAGTLGPDPGAANAAEADHEIVITFNMIVNFGITTVQNLATLNADLNDDGDFGDPGETPAASAQAVWETELPGTGFPPDSNPILNRSLLRDNSAVSELQLEIPRLGIRIPILWLPSTDNSWDISWLWDQAGLLEGTAYPGLSGNSVMVGHTNLGSGMPGPFADLSHLWWGDEIIVHAHGLRHVYLVRERAYVLPNDVSVLRHEDDAWITLITCHDYDYAKGSYNYRLVVRAVRVRVNTE